MWWQRPKPCCIGEMSAGDIKPADVFSERAKHVFLNANSPSDLVTLPKNQLAFEIAVLENIKQTNSLVRAAIEAQLESATIVSRVGSGVGFKLFFEVSREAKVLPNECPFPLDGTGYVLKGIGGPALMEEGVPEEFVGSSLCGAILLHYDGYIEYLDCHNYGDAKWPRDKYEFWFFDNEASE